jgi:hypothetical protein
LFVNVNSVNCSKCQFDDIMLDKVCRSAKIRDYLSR